MTSSTIKSLNNGTEGQLRKVAILVATLDKPLAERLLASLPARDEAAVREIFEQLQDIDPDEQQAVLEDFHKGIAEPQKPLESQKPSPPLRTKLEGVELDASLLARMDDENFPATMLPTNHSTSPWQALSDADASTLVEMLSAEQPQTIAVVLSRIETSRSAEILLKLSPTLQAEVLTRLSNLDPADEQTLEVVASQLAQWLSAQRQRKQRLIAGQELVQRILQDTTETQRSVLLTRLENRDPALAAELSAKPSKYLPFSAFRSKTTVAAAYRQAPVEMPEPANEQEQANEIAKSANLPSDPLLELEALDEQGLLRALRHADRQTVMLALAGAGESLMKRIVKGLPRRKANQFRQQVRSIGPTRLSDMLAAQHELLRCSHELQA